MKLKRVIEGIQRGELLHNQEHYHCGSAHSVVGWYVFLEAEERGLDYIKDNLWEGEEIVDEWEIVKEECGLSIKEVANIALARLSIRDIVINWNWMNKGYEELQVCYSPRLD